MFFRLVISPCFNSGKIHTVSSQRPSILRRSLFQTCSHIFFFFFFLCFLILTGYLYNVKWSKRGPVLLKVLYLCICSFRITTTLLSTQWTLGRYERSCQAEHIKIWSSSRLVASALASNKLISAIRVIMFGTACHLSLIISRFRSKLEILVIF